MEVASSRSLPFELVRPIGRGAAGEVWEGLHPSGERVALKFLSADTDRVALARELEATGRLDHPAVVALWDAGEHEGRPWIALEHMAGGTLGEQAARLRWDDVQGALEAVLAGLAHAHAHGVVHRDLKPGNVLRASTGGRWAIADFGIARIDRGELEDPLSGTPAYMAPEQWTGDGRREGPHTDLWAVGSMTWMLCTGEPAGLGPFAPRIPVPEGLMGWLGALLVRDPAQRCDVAADALEALRGLGGARGVGQARGVPRVLTTASLGAATWAGVEGDPGPEIEAPAAETLPVASFRRLGARLRPVPPGALGVSVLARRARPAPNAPGDLDPVWALLEGGGTSRVAVVGSDNSGRAAWVAHFARLAVESGAARWLDLRAGSPSMATQVAPRFADTLPRGAARALVGSGRNRTTALALLLAHVATERPLIAWVGPEVLVELAGTELGNCLVIAVSSEELEVEHTVRIAPRSAAEVQAALRNRLPLTEEAVRLLVARSGGLPGRADALLVDLARRGALNAGPGGVSVDEGALESPDAVPESARVIALGGDRVAAADWSAVLEVLGLPSDDGQWLVSRGFARFEEGGLAFSGVAARQTMLEGAMLDAARAWVDQVGRHPELLLRAGEVEAGVRAVGAELAHAHLDVANAMAWVELLERFGETRGRALAQAWRADFAVEAGRVAEAEERAERALSWAPSDPAVQARCAVAHAQVARARGRDPTPDVVRALAAFEADGDRARADGCRLWLAELADGDDLGASLDLLEALRHVETPHVRVAAERRLLLYRAGAGLDVDEAAIWAEAALERALDAGELSEAMHLLNSLGTIHRQRGDQAARVAAFERGAALARGSSEIRAIFALNLGVARVEIGDFDGARDAFRLSERVSPRADVGALAGLGLACCALVLDDDQSLLQQLRLPRGGTAAGLLLAVVDEVGGSLRGRVLDVLRDARRALGDRELAERIDRVLASA